jgi:ribosomal protein S18 acetylase RimI-like enzyme
LLSIEPEEVIRPCREDDLERLEWFGAFSEHRAIIREAFEMQGRGEALMLVADRDGFPVGQAWVKYDPAGRGGCGRLWAVRVMAALQGRGLGTRLVAAAEAAMREAGCTRAEVGVETHNPGARRLYERLGYRMERVLIETWEYVAPGGETRRTPLEQWLLSKRLR